MAPSGGESQRYGLLKGVALGFGFFSFVQHWDVTGKLAVFLCHRLRWTKQFGHMRLAQTRYLQVRERTREGHVKVLLVRSKNSPVDLFMQAVSGTLREQRLKVLAARACQCVQETQGSSVELNDGPVDRRSYHFRGMLREIRQEFEGRRLLTGEGRGQSRG